MAYKIIDVEGIGIEKMVEQAKELEAVLTY